MLCWITLGWGTQMSGEGEEGGGGCKDGEGAEGAGGGRRSKRVEQFFVSQFFFALSSFSIGN
jgi:hypothetical protein